MSERHSYIIEGIGIHDAISSMGPIAGSDVHTSAYEHVRLYETHAHCRCMNT